MGRWVTAPADRLSGGPDPGRVTSPPPVGGPACPATPLAHTPCLAGSDARSLLPASIVTSSTLSTRAPEVPISVSELLLARWLPSMTERKNKKKPKIPSALDVRARLVAISLGPSSDITYITENSALSKDRREMYLWIHTSGS